MSARTHALFLVLALALILPRGATAQAPSPCTGPLEADEVPVEPGPRLRFGINPAGEAGALGPPVPAVRPSRTLDALSRLDPTGAPFAVRLNRFFWSEGSRAVRRFLRLTDRYTRHRGSTCAITPRARSTSSTATACSRTITRRNPRSTCTADSSLSSRVR